MISSKSYITCACTSHAFYLHYFCSQMIDLNKEIRTRIFHFGAVASLCTLLILYLTFQFDYDHFHSYSDRIYTFTTKFSTPGETVSTSISSWTTASAIKSKSRFVEQTARVAYSQLRLKGNSHLDAKGLFADASIFEIFDFPVISGNKKTALKSPFNIVLTENAAVKLFGYNNPLGKIVFLEDFDCTVTVTAVAKNLSDNSQIRTDAFISMPTLVKLNNSNSNRGLEAISVITYILLRPKVSAKLILKKLSALFSGKMVQEQKLMATRKTIIFKPLRATLINPVLTQFQIFSLCTFSLISFLMLLVSIRNVVKIFLLQITLSDIDVTIKQRARKLIRKVFSVIMITYLFSYFISAGLIYGLKNIFDITIIHSPYLLLHVGAAMVITLITTSIFLSLCINYLIPAEPIKTYLALAKINARHSQVDGEI